MRIGILGATGAVGEQMLKVMEERGIDCELRLFASERSLGRTLPFMGREAELTVCTPQSLRGLDFLLGAAEADVSRELLPMIRESGAVYIDNSSAFRLEPDVPLVIPQINGEDALAHHGVVANPNCSTIITYMALAPIHRLSPLKTLVASTYQAVSGAGKAGLRELEDQVAALSSGQSVTPQVFPAQIAYNCIAQIGSYDSEGYTSEEMKMQNEGRKILHSPNLKVTCTCVRVPVFRSHSISATFETESHVTVEQAENAISAASGVVLMNEPVAPPLDTSDQDLVYVSRLRRDLTSENGLSLWCCGDQIRKGAATNAVEIMEYLMAH